MKTPFPNFKPLPSYLTFRPERCGTITAFLLNLCFIFSSQAQYTEWDKTIGANNTDFSPSMQLTQDGGYILGGSSNSDKMADKSEANQGEFDYWVVKLNANKTIAWDKTIGGNKEDHLSAIQQTSDGGYILGGFSSSDISSHKTQANKGAADYWIVKLKADGTKAWDKVFGGSGTDMLTSLQVTKDGGFILAGYSDSGAGGDKTHSSQGQADYWVIKLRADGSKEWDKTFGGNQADNLSTLCLTTDGGYLLGGTSVSGISGDKTQAGKGRKDYWIVKLNANGTKAWDKTYGGDKDDQVAALLPTRDGGYLVGGTSVSAINGDKTQASRDLDDYEIFDSEGDFWVIKLKANGSKQWDRTIGGNNGEVLAAIQQAQDGSFVIGGSSASDVGQDRTEAPWGATVYDYWIVGLKEDGTSIWDKTVAGFSDDYLRSMVLTPDGGCLLSGHSNSRKYGDKSEENKNIEGSYDDYWLVKMKGPVTFHKTQQITFATILNQNYVVQKDVLVSATASSGLPVLLTVVSGPATVKNNQVTLTGTGVVTIKASQAGNTEYFEAKEVTHSFEVINSPLTKLWDKTFGGIRTGFNADDEACGVILGASTFSAILNTPDGGYLLAGTSDSEQGNDKSQKHYGELANQTCYFEDDIPIVDYWLVKTDSNGNKKWDKIIGGNNYDRLVTMIATPEGGYLLAGNSRSGKSHDKSEAAIGISDYWLVKIDAAGNKIWDKTLGTSGYDDLTSVIATPDGGYLLADANFKILKIDAEGKKLWQKTFAASGRLNVLYRNPAGGYLLGATNGDYYLIQVDAQGNKQWQKTYGGNQAEGITSIVTTPDGGFLLGGTSSSGVSGDRTQPSQGSDDYWLVKIDNYGNKLWDKRYGGTGSDELVTLQVTQDNNYILAGNSSSSRSGDKSEINRGEETYDDFNSTDYWLVKVDAIGNILWDKTYGGTRYSNKLQAVLVNPNGTWVIGGTSVSDIGADKSAPLKGTTDFWIIKVQEKNAPETTVWDMRFGGYGTDNLTTLIQTADGGYLSGGYTNSSATGDKTQRSQGKNDYWIVKSDQNGKKLWDKRFGGYSDDYLNHVIQTPDGGYLLAGSSYSQQSGDKSQPSRGDRDYWLVKTDENGNKQWDQRYGGTGEDELKRVLILSSGSYLLAGTSNSPVSGDKSQASKGGQDYWILKITPDGKKVWDQNYGGTGEDVLEDLALALNGDLLLGGSSTSGANGDRTQGNRGASDFWVLRLAENGAKIWDKRFGGSREDQLTVVGTTPTGNLYVAGTTTSQRYGDLTYRGRGRSDYWLLELTSTGTKVWDRLFGANAEEELQAVQVTSQGNYLLAGSSRSDVWLDKTQYSQGGQDYWVVEANRAGIVWDQRYGGSEDDELRAMVLTSDGGYVLAGRSSSGVSGDRTQPRQGSPDYWLVKAAPTTNTRVTARMAAEPEVKAEQLNVLAYPNPFHDKLIIRFTLPETQTTTVRVLDSQGRALTTLFQGQAQADQTYEVEWQAGKQANGMYLLQLQTPTKQKTQKLLLRK